MRANVFRNTPESRPCSIQLALRICATSGRSEGPHTGNDLLLIPPASRLKGSLADYFREERDLYAGSGRSTVPIDVRPVVSDRGRVVDYVLKTVLAGRLSYDDAVVVLPRSRREL